MTEIQTRPLCVYHANLEQVQHNAGKGPFGRRMIAVVTGGAFEGERLAARSLVEGETGL